MEDSPDDEFVFRDTMRRSGISNPVSVVRDGEDAIAYLGRDERFADTNKYPPPAVLFLDLRMPKVSGFEVLRWIKSQPHLKELLIIILTNHHEVKVINEAYELGAHTFLTKPMTRAELNNLVLHFDGTFHGGLPQPQAGSAS